MTPYPGRHDGSKSRAPAVSGQYRHIPCQQKQYGIPSPARSGIHMPQLQYQMKINIVPGNFTDMPECDSYCFRESVYWQSHIILFRAGKYN